MPAINLDRAADLIVDLAFDNPALYDRIMDASALQSVLDPEAGFKALQTHLMFSDLELSDNAQAKLMEQASNSYKFYVALRAYSLGFGSMLGMDNFLNGGGTLDFPLMLEYISTLSKRFNVERCKLHM